MNFKFDRTLHQLWYDFVLNIKYWSVLQDLKNKKPLNAFLNFLFFNYKNVNWVALLASTLITKISTDTKIHESSCLLFWFSISIIRYITRIHMLPLKSPSTLNDNFKWLNSHNTTTNNNKLFEQIWTLPFLIHCESKKIDLS